GFHAWADRYDRTLADVFAVQEEIASSIAAALQVALTPAETRALVQNRPNDARAYDLYLKGRDRYGHYSPESLREALALFQQATEVDPHYALAWAGMADCYGQFVQWGVADDPAENVRLGLTAARRALSLDPRLPEAHKSESLALRASGDNAGARAALVRALEANPRFTPALINLAVVRFTTGDLAGAERLIRRALEADPQEAFAAIWLLYIAVLTGRDDELMATALRLRELTDNAFYVSASHDLRVWLHVMRGDLDRAERVVREGTTEGVDVGSREAAKALIAARAGRMDEARRIVRELETEKSTRLGALRNAAVAALAVGEHELAADYMTRRPADVSAVQVRLDPEAHALLDREPFAPPRMDTTLVWPLEAPMIPPACHALFRDVRIESGRPTGSGID
ncbi:MAG TPA: tetratricopeptide repeat protein, partial [Candidatus Eisenbacteria bacterium]|nr:tetratricopeptide repeat protein [Candidatus Eisenbacteria bacterium]